MEQELQHVQIREKRIQESCGNLNLFRLGGLKRVNKTASYNFQTMY